MMARRKILVTYLMAWLFAIGTALRYLSHSRSHPEQVPPDILGALAALFAAFFALWVLTFGYVYSIHTRQQRLEQELGLTQEPSDR